MTKIISSRLFKSSKDGYTYLATKSTWKKGTNPSDYKLKLQRLNSDGTLSEPLITKTVTKKATEKKDVFVKKILRETDEAYFEIKQFKPSPCNKMCFNLRSKAGYAGKPYALKGQLSSVIEGISRFKVPDIAHKKIDDYPLYVSKILKEIQRALSGRR
jgi:hypothetical protein